ncbi:hypothetical protein UA08_09442 [Talaromyces atroroseus]|uniref:Uncharacterized protein n=1 Tax=Talaromyces atroroseus TaxID=1441469 RepID=A0A225A9Q3_TALAT|nr:hypothetical protein UA08_09442 [Talaromyces atroroseus]OKL55293.1 hypothetical protein UA08_09442 [Talaromyces atroroseus]
MDSRDVQITHAIDFIYNCTEDEIHRHGEQMNLLVSRIGAVRSLPNRTDKSQPLIAAHQFLAKVQSSLDATYDMQDCNIVEFVIIAMRRKTLSTNENASLAFCSLGRGSNEIDRQLHVQCALYHAIACYGTDDPLTRSSNREEFYLGKIPAYCDKVNAELAVMRRCIRTGSKLEYLRRAAGGPGLLTVLARVVTSLNLVPWPVLQKVAMLMEEYPLILAASHDFKDQSSNLNAAY